MTRQAQAQALPIEHRSAISPLALLGLRLVTAARVNETPETTSGYSWSMRDDNTVALDSSRLDCRVIVALVIRG